MKLFILAHLVSITALLSRMSAYGSASSYPSSAPAFKLKLTSAPQPQKNQQPFTTGRPKTSL